MIQGRRLSKQELHERLAADRARLLKFMTDADQGRIRRAWLAVKLYRWSQYHYGQGRRTLGRLIWQLNLTLTGADLNPIADFGPGLVVPSPLGVTLYAVAGRDLTAHAQTVLGGGRSRKDIGAGPGRPLLGDNVTLGHGAMVLGPVRVGDAADIGPGCVVMHDVAANSRLAVALPEPTMRGEKRG
ncbi:MAG: serine O-acetyltransferase [Gammaproteobacteria bacterium]